MQTTNKFSGEDNGNKWSIKQHENGMYLASIKWDDGDISAITCRIPAEYMQFFEDYNIKIYKN